MRKTVVCAAVAALLVCCLFAASGNSDPDLKPSDDTLKVSFCHFPLSNKVKDMNVSFNLVYRFRVSSNGVLTNPEAVTDRFVGPDAVAECIENWHLPNLEKGEVVSVGAYWKHGVGWMHLNISSETFSQQIGRVGDLSPYPVASEN